MYFRLTYIWFPAALDGTETDRDSKSSANKVIDKSKLSSLDSLDTTKCIPQKHELKVRIAIKKPTLNKNHLEARWSWLKNNEPWDADALNKIIFNDSIYQPLCSGRIWHKVIFKRSLTGLNSEFSFSYTSCLTKAEEPSLSYYLPIAGGRIIGFIHFPRVLVLCEMQSVSSRIWTRVAVSISYDDNNYTTGTSIIIIIIIIFNDEAKIKLHFNRLDLLDVLQKTITTTLHDENWDT